MILILNTSYHNAELYNFHLTFFVRDTYVDYICIIHAYLKPKYFRFN